MIEQAESDAPERPYVSDATGVGAAFSTPVEPADSPPPAQYRISRSIAVLTDPEGARAESIRSLRAHLLAGHMANGRRSLAVCGAGDESGSTFLAVNLAIAFANNGISTLLIDADIAEGGVEKFLQPDRPLPGLLDILDSPERMAVENIRAEVLPNLSVIYSGTGRRRNAAEAFGSRQFKTLIDDCMRDHEITIVNTPSGHGSANVRVIAKSVRYALIVARRDHTMMSDVRSLVEELDSDRVNLIGTFLSDV